MTSSWELLPVEALMGRDEYCMNYLTAFRAVL